MISVDQFGTGTSELAIVVPLTRKYRTSLDVPIDPPEGGVSDVSYAMPYQVRTISRERLTRRRGAVKDATLGEVIRRVKLLISEP